MATASWSGPPSSSGPPCERRTCRLAMAETSSPSSCPTPTPTRHRRSRSASWRSSRSGRSRPKGVVPSPSQPPSGWPRSPATVARGRSSSPPPIAPSTGSRMRADMARAWLARGCSGSRARRAACVGRGQPRRLSRRPRRQWTGAERRGSTEVLPAARQRYCPPDWTGPSGARILDAVAGRPHRTKTDDSAHDRRIRRSWWFLAGSFFLLGLVTALRLLAGVATRLDWILAGLVILVGLAVVIHREAVAALEEGRRSEAESFARILQGLSRSVSPDAIVDAIVEDLGAGTGADHIVVVRLRPGTEILEATLVSQRPGVPSTRTVLPALDAGNAPFAGATHGGVRGGVDGSDDRAGHGADAGRGSTLGERLPSGMPVRAGEPELVPVA